MIIISIFLYFIEIAHTDDFPSTSTRLVCTCSNNIISIQVNSNRDTGRPEASI